jgi:hypothetical protein
MSELAAGVGTHNARSFAINCSEQGPLPAAMGRRILAVEI